MIRRINSETTFTRQPGFRRRRTAFLSGVGPSIARSPKSCPAAIPEAALDPAAGNVALQFAVLGFVSVALNTLADVAVAFAASGIRAGAAARPGLVRRLREASGACMIALGLGLALTRRRDLTDRGCPRLP
ncbi:hypothetical protein [Microvirga thermotolerans]|uniref:hypothetical protein n=1 Tax=Microvirga thermotolerans TaxID=2651334 RepID=UPI001FE7327F|nr:hypothetical protein [Microvirga thermotolerans]